MAIHDGTNMKIGFTCGAFDLLHAGHIVMLKEAKSECDYLIVGLQTDPSIDRQEKNQPIQTVYERYMQLQAVKYIDEIIPYDTEQSPTRLIRGNTNPYTICRRGLGRRHFTGKGLHEIYYTSRNHSFPVQT